MKITFLGATHEVTGSCTLLEVCGKHIIVDCGMEQGIDTFENEELPVNPAEVDCVILTHAHVDHSGHLPLLYKRGFRGSIYATAATCDLCEIMLRDCAHIQESEAEWRSRKAKRSGGEAYEPVYDINDAEGALNCMRRCDYDSEMAVSEGVRVTYRHVGHLMGAASVELVLTENGVTKKIVFSGDVGNRYQPIINDEKTVTDADYIVIESTYGDRLHGETEPHYVEQLADIIQRTFDRGGNVVIPSFAVGRTQEILYFIRQIKNDGMVKGHDNFPVYMDSPLANEATAVFLQCDSAYLDEQTNAIIAEGENPIFFSGLVTAVSSDESKAINFDKRPKVIISASGMCEAGRIRHHLKHNLWRPESTILFVGYQSVGTLGRSIHDGAKKVKLFGEEIRVAAKIETLEGISGHADRDGLFDWISGFEKKPAQVFVNHGDDGACTSFTELLRDRGWNAFAPYSGTVYDLAAGEFIEKPDGVPVEKKKQPSTAYDRLVSSGERLMALIRRSDGFANKELAKLASQIDAMCDKWDK